mmetsp:Transcript_33146/g.87529  ORF Transcript_33146/g.87529 Transcript_33146/m.87529 type:complete len:204 (-) Transcript_33146:522-1133(-)
MSAWLLREVRILPASMPSGRRCRNPLYGSTMSAAKKVASASKSSSSILGRKPGESTRVTAINFSFLTECVASCNTCLFKPSVCPALAETFGRWYPPFFFTLIMRSRTRGVIRDDLPAFGEPQKRSTWGAPSLCPCSLLLTSAALSSACCKILRVLTLNFLSAEFSKLSTNTAVLGCSPSAAAIWWRSAASDSLSAWVRHLIRT